MDMVDIDLGDSASRNDASFNAAVHLNLSEADQDLVDQASALKRSGVERDEAFLQLLATLGDDTTQKARRQRLASLSLIRTHWDCI